MGIVTGIITAAAAVYGAVQQRKAAKASARSQAAQQRQADLASARERRALIRQGRGQRASIEAQAAATGLQGSSAASAAISNVTSRTNENLSFLDQSSMLSQKASIANQQAAGYQSKAGLAQAVGQASSQIGQQFGV